MLPLDHSSGRFNRSLVLECVGIGEQIGMQFQIGDGYHDRWSQKVCYDADRLAILKGDLVGLCVDGN